MMPRIVYHTCNTLLHSLHLTLICFFLFGWIWPQTRYVHVLIGVLILFSWTVLGMKYGFGYCLITDLQWRLKRYAGKSLHTEYYVKYILDKAGIELEGQCVNYISTLLFFSIMSLSTALFLRHP
jgi:hypothetical protein